MIPQQKRHPMLNDLDDALRAGGIRHWIDPGWRTRSHGDIGPIRGILNHHTAGGSTRDWLTVRDGRPDLQGPLANLTLERDGLVRLLAAGQCWHAGTGSHPLIGTNNGNIRMIGIEGVSPGIGANAWTPQQIEVLPLLNAMLCRWYGLTAAACLFHLEWATPRGRKIDINMWPGGPNAFRSRTGQLLGSAPITAPAVPVAFRSRRRRS
jgi:hypothetical protein